VKPPACQSERRAPGMGCQVVPCSVSVIISALNESAVIGSLVARIRELYPDFEIIVVNDGSEDETARVALEAGAFVYSHPYTIGNGAAVKSGIRIASGEILVLMDGDGQHRPEDIPRLLQYLPEFDMVVGARCRCQQTNWWRAAGNRVFNCLASYVTQFEVQDLTSGFRAVKSETAKDFLNLLPNTYSYPTTITLAALHSGRSLKYEPINVLKRRTGKSGIRCVEDGIRFLLILMKVCTLFAPLRVFLPTSIAMFLTGLGCNLWTFLTAGRFNNMGALFLTTSVLIFMLGLISEQISQMRFDRSARP